MKATLEISMYPLTENYEQVVINFIEKVKTRPNLRVEVNGLSTQVFGDYDEVMKLLSEDAKSSLEDQKAVFVFKLAAGELTKEQLPENLK